jgi:hypothetical protein
MHEVYFGVAVLIASAATAFLLGLFPVFHHLAYGLVERRSEILCMLNADSARLYFERFEPANAAKLAGNPERKLHELYDSRFGRRTYRWPIAAYVPALLLAIVVIAAAAGAQLPGKPIVALIDPLAAYALAGAYLWVVSDLISRYRQRNLVPSSLYFAAFRIVIAIPLAVALSAAVKDDFAQPLAFLLGAFPTSTLFLIARRMIGQKLGLGDQGEANKLPELEALQGVTRQITETFSDIGVSTLVQLAYEDPIQLSMRTNLSFNYVLDLVSQALVAIYVKSEIARCYSMRGSVEASYLAAKYFKLDETVKQVITALAGKLDIPEAALSVILYQISEDPYAKFINSIWSPDDTDDEDQKPSSEMILSAVEIIVK